MGDKAKISAVQCLESWQKPAHVNCGMDRNGATPATATSKRNKQPSHRQNVGQPSRILQNCDTCESRRLRKAVTQPPKYQIHYICLRRPTSRFWPWADTLNPSNPDMLNLSNTIRTDDAQKQFFAAQLHHEHEKGQYSKSVSRVPLRGMFCMPIYAVPKPHSSDFRLVNDHSASKHSLNSMIDHNSVTGFPLDSLAQYGHMLADLCA